MKKPLKITEKDFLDKLEIYSLWDIFNLKPNNKIQHINYLNGDLGEYLYYLDEREDYVEDFKDEHPNWQYRELKNGKEYLSDSNIPFFCLVQTFEKEVLIYYSNKDSLRTSFRLSEDCDMIYYSTLSSIIIKHLKSNWLDENTKIKLLYFIDFDESVLQETDFFWKL